MGKLMVVVTRFLSLCAVLLALHPVAIAQPTPLAVQRVWTQDTGGNIKTTFAPGETIQFAAELNNSYGGTLLGVNGTQLTITTSFYNDTRPVDIPPGISTWTWNATAPSTEGSYTVTVKAYDHASGTLPEGSASFTVGVEQSQLPPQITHVETFREGDLVFFRLFYTDPNNDAEGFGFRGAGGEETHPFSDPSFGRVSPGIVEYPFNLGCETGPAYETHIEAWIYDSAGLISTPVTVHLACTQFKFQELPVDFSNINYINWYGNTEFAYQKRDTIYKELQGLHSGIDFIAPDGTPIRSVVSRSGEVVSINNEPHKYKTGPGNLLIDYGDFLVLYGHTQKSNLPEKIKLGALINPNDTIAYVGADRDGLIHLHLEVIRKDPPGSGRPGHIRTNPVPFFSSTALDQLKQKARGIGATFHPIPGETKWQTPEDQPDITPGGPLLVP